MQQVQRNAGAAGSQGMSDGNGSTIYVGPLAIEPQLLFDREILGSESLVRGQVPKPAGGEVAHVDRADLHPNQTRNRVPDGFEHPAHDWGGVGRQMAIDEKERGVHVVAAKDVEQQRRGCRVGPIIKREVERRRRDDHLQPAARAAQSAVQRRGCGTGSPMGASRAPPPADT